MLTWGRELFCSALLGQPRQTNGHAFAALRFNGTVSWRQQVSQHPSMCADYTYLTHEGSDISVFWVAYLYVHANDLCSRQVAFWMSLFDFVCTAWCSKAADELHKRAWLGPPTPGGYKVGAG